MSESAGASRAGVVLSVLPVAEHPAWHEHATCRGKGPALFFPELGKRSAYAEARQLCDGCPVRSECAAAGAHEGHGVWGGTTPPQRHPRRPSRVA